MVLEPPMMPITGRSLSMKNATRALSMKKSCVRWARPSTMSGARPPCALTYVVDAPVQRGGVVCSGVPALHQIVARVQALGLHDVGTLDVGQDILES